MVSNYIFGVAALLGLSTLSSGHLIMQNPVPYSVDTLDNSPLINAAPGTAESNFPCKLRANAFEVSQENMINVGDSNTMTWKGSASHGGGTCQLSVTLDREPTAKSTFKVIASWIGGCPTSADGNGGTIPFNWTMPAEIPNGKATLAWNWVSKLSGQPENYMNCAPVTVSGGASNTDEYQKLEDLFLVNLPSSSCGSQASHDLEIPNPGKYVTTFKSDALATPTGSGCAASGQAAATEQAGSGSGSASSAAVSSYADSSSAAAATSAPASKAAGPNAQVSLVFPTSSAAAPSSSAAAADTSVPPVYTSAPAATSAASSAAAGAYGAAAPSGSGGSYSSGSDTNGSSSGTSSSSGGTGTCTTNGAVVCNGSTQFGLCNFGKVVWQDVAAGTTCEDGQVRKKRSVHVVRHARHPHARSFA